MKKIMSLIMFVVCGFLLTGCSPTVLKSNTIKMASVEVELQAVPVAADLKVSEKRVSGQAGGKIDKKRSKEDIVSEALTKAMGQEPPSADGPDVLVGINMFEAWKDKKRFSVTVTGYPAWYTNFHNAPEIDSSNLLVTGAWGGLGGRYQMGGLADKAHRVSNAPKVKEVSDGYFAARYVTPWGIPSTWGGVDLEGGWVWGNGTFFGIDLLAGGFNGSTREYADGRFEGEGGFVAGGGFNFGGVYDLSVENLKLVYGAAAGFWRVEDWSRNDENLTSNFLAPFIKLRWNLFELSYRGLLGITEVEQKGYYGYGDDETETGFGWNQHQISLGVYFEGSKRWKDKK